MSRDFLYFQMASLETWKHVAFVTVPVGGILVRRRESIRKDSLIF